MTYEEINGETIKEIKSVEEYVKEILEINNCLKNNFSDNSKLSNDIDDLKKFNKQFNENKNLSFFENNILSFIKQLKCFNREYKTSPHLTKTKVYDQEKYRVDNSQDDIDIFYRGVHNKDFNLLPSCFRKEHYGKESIFYHYIMAKCPSEFKQRNHLDSLVTLQHYECPTRLLDITTNPLVALYFACKNYGFEKCDKNNFGYVYIFAELRSNLLFKNSDKAIMLSCLANFSLEEQEEIYIQCAKRISEKGIGAIFDQKREAQCIEKLYHEIRTEIDFEKRILAIDLLKNYYVIPDYTNRRIARQNGAFILTGVCKNQEFCEKNINNEVVCKIKISNQEEILKQLDILGINEATLFPEMDKVAKYFIEKLKQGEQK